MLQTKKDYHSLREVSTEMGPLRHRRSLLWRDRAPPSVPLFGIFGEYPLPEESVFNEDDDGPTLDGERRVDGPVDLNRSHIADLFRDGEIRLHRVDTEDGRTLLLGDAAITVRLRDLVVRKEERLRFETEELPRRLEPTERPCFSDIAVGGKRYTFEPMPAAVLQWLYERALKDNSWYSVQDVLGAVPTQAVGLAAVFRRHRKERGDLIEKGSRGRYRFFPAKAREIAGRGKPTE